MAKLEELTRGAALKGILPDQLVTVVDVRWIGNTAIELIYKDALGFLPKDVSSEKLEYDLESSFPNTGRLRFIEVKGRVAGAKTVTVTTNEVLTALNKPEEFILALVELDGDASRVRYVRTPFQREPDFSVTSINYDLDELLQRAEEPA